MMSGSIFVCSVAIWISFGPVLLSTPATSIPTKSSQPDREGDKISLQDQAVIDDISSLRQLVGGSPFETDVDGFKAALAHFVDEPAADASVLALPGAELDPSDETFADRDEANQPAELDLVEHLRVSAELLERKANRLERSRDFEKADRLRELASQIRLQARQL